jgi:hypothetical protein
VLQILQRPQVARDHASAAASDLDQVQGARPALVRDEREGATVGRPGQVSARRRPLREPALAARGAVHQVEVESLVGVAIPEERDPAAIRRDARLQPAGPWVARGELVDRVSRQRRAVHLERARRVPGEHDLDAVA